MPVNAPAFDWAGGDRIHANTITRKLDGPRFCQVLQGGLGGGIVGQYGVAAFWDTAVPIFTTAPLLFLRAE